MTNPSQLFFQILCQGSVCIGGSTGTPPEKAFYLATHFLLAVLISNPAQVQSKPAIADKPERSAIQTGSLASNLPQTETSEPQIKAELGSSISSACQSQVLFQQQAAEFGLLAAHFLHKLVGFHHWHRQGAIP